MRKKKAVHVNPWNLIFNNQDNYADSIVVGLGGPKRAGKSLVMAAVVYRELWKGRKVWSNLPIKTPKYFLDKGYPLIESIPIDWDALFTLSEEYQDGLLVLDEASYYNNIRNTMHSRNRVTNAFTNQIGHRNLDVIWTAKSVGWLDRQGLGFETDVIIFCQDMAKTAYGRRNGFKKGRNIHLRAFDKSGQITGMINDPTQNNKARPFISWYMNNMDIYWDAYSTKHLMSIEEMFTGIKLDMEKKVISNRPDYSTRNENIYEILTQIKPDDDGLVPAGMVQAAINITGNDVNPLTLGKVIKSLGGRYIPKKEKGEINYYYDLSGIA